MTLDLVSAATRALRERTDGRSERASDTEARVVEQLAPRPRVLRFPVRFGLAAALAGSTVWAGAGGRFERLVEGAVDRLGGVSSSSNVPSEPHRWLDDAAHEDTAHEDTAQDETAQDETALGDSAQDEAAQTDRRAPMPVAPGRTENRAGMAGTSSSLTRAPASSATRDQAAPELDPGSQAAPAPQPRELASPSQTASPEPDPPVTSAQRPSPSRAELDAYEEAHRLHFVTGDLASALRGWDAYLGSYPHGTLALEARFHRAVCLVELGQIERARRELEPFARGAHGGYRKAESERLLDRLDRLDRLD